MLLDKMCEPLLEKLLQEEFLFRLMEVPIDNGGGHIVCVLIRSQRFHSRMKIIFFS
jgi:hypothetical protein